MNKLAKLNPNEIDAVSGGYYGYIAVSLLSLAAGYGACSFVCNMLNQIYFQPHINKLKAGIKISDETLNKLSKIENLPKEAEDIIASIVIGATNQADNSTYPGEYL